VKEEIERLAKEYEKSKSRKSGSSFEEKLRRSRSRRDHTLGRRSIECRNGSKERDNEIISVDISVRGQLLARDRKAPRKSSEARKKKIGIQEGDIRR
jgi:hypothetical protein